MPKLTRRKRPMPASFGLAPSNTQGIAFNAARSLRFAKKKRWSLASGARKCPPLQGKTGLTAQHLAIDAQRLDGRRAVGTDRYVDRERAGPVVQHRLEVARPRFRDIELDAAVSVVERRRREARPGAGVPGDDQAAMGIGPVAGLPSG